MFFCLLQCLFVCRKLCPFCVFHYLNLFSCFEGFLKNFNYNHKEVCGICCLFVCLCFLFKICLKHIVYINIVFHTSINIVSYIHISVRKDHVQLCNVLDWSLQWCWRVCVIACLRVCVLLCLFVCLLQCVFVRDPTIFVRLSFV